MLNKEEMIQPGKRGSLLAPLVKDNLPASKGSSGRHFLTPEETPHVRSRRERTEHTKRRESAWLSYSGIPGLKPVVITSSAPVPE